MSKIFTNLHVHSFFSIGDSIARPEDIVLRAKALGMDTIAVTDHGTIASWLMMKEAGARHGVKIIFGMEAYFIDDQRSITNINTRIDEIKESIDANKALKPKPLKKVKKGEPPRTQMEEAKHRAEIDHFDALITSDTKKLEELQEAKAGLRKYNHLILLAKNWRGCNALIKMHNAAVIDGYYYKPRLDWAVLEKYVTKGDIIATSACLGGRIAKLVAQSDFAGALDNVNRFNHIFGKGNFYLELQLNEIQLQRDVNIELIKLAEATETPMVLTCDSHFVDEGGHETRGIIRQLGEEDYSNNDDQLVDLYIKNEDILLKNWQQYMGDVPLKHLATAIKNTRAIAESISDFPFDTSLKFPTFETGNDDSQEDFLTKMALKGLVAKGKHTDPLYVTQLKHELKTINKLGFASYFNVVGDLVGDARKRQPVGPGRGSAAGSLVAFCLGITNVDPLKFKLFFERFLDESKGVIMPTFGLQIAKMSLNTEKLLKACDCHKHD